MRDAMMKNHPHAAETADKMQQNVRNLPLTSLILAGMLGAGMVALARWWWHETNRS